jgi:hypothetical protein
MGQLISSTAIGLSLFTAIEARSSLLGRPPRAILAAMAERVFRGERRAVSSRLRAVFVAFLGLFSAVACGQTASDPDTSSITEPPNGTTCVVAIKLDDCCYGPVAVSSRDLEEDACLVPLETARSILDELFPECNLRFRRANPGVCDVELCAHATEPPATSARLGSDGRCEFAPG